MTTWQLADHLCEMLKESTDLTWHEARLDMIEYLEKVLKEWQPL